MDLEEFTQKVRAQFLDDDQPQVTPDVRFRTLSTWDSLTGMAIITTIQDDYGVNIPVNDFLKLSTVRELFDYVGKARA